jgi:hypothetical protein
MKEHHLVPQLLDGPKPIECLLVLALRIWRGSNGTEPLESLHGRFDAVA